MSDYWFTDEYGRKRHVHEGTSSNTNSVKYRHDSIYNSFYKNGGESKESYLSLTKCPKCGDKVYFCNCSNGGRVFFDTLAPDWDKHPCTSVSMSKPINNNTYSMIIPAHNYYQKHKDYERRSTVFEVPSFLKTIKLNTSDEVLYKNITQNTMILVRGLSSSIFLTIIITSEKFKNHRLCENKHFKKQNILQEYIISLLSKVDFSISIDTSNEIIYTKDNKKIIKIDKLQSMKINQTKKKFRKVSNIKSTNKKHPKQKFKTLEESEYIPKNDGLKIKKKKAEKVKDSTLNEIDLNMLKNNGWKVT